MDVKMREKCGWSLQYQQNCLVVTTHLSNCTQSMALFLYTVGIKYTSFERITKCLLS